MHLFPKIAILERKCLFTLRIEAKNAWILETVNDKNDAYVNELKRYDVVKRCRVKRNNAIKRCKTSLWLLSKTCKRVRSHSRSVLTHPTSQEKEKKKLFPVATSASLPICWFTSGVIWVFCCPRTEKGDVGRRMFTLSKGEPAYPACVRVRLCWSEISKELKTSRSNPHSPEYSWYFI